MRSSMVIRSRHLEHRQPGANEAHLERQQDHPGEVWRRALKGTLVKRVALLAPLLLGTSGCGLTASPSLPFYGAYFPSWLLCAAFGILASVLVRIFLIRLGVDEGIPFRTLVYIALACLIAFVLAATVFGR